MDIPDQRQVVLVHPLHRRPDAFRRIICSRQHIFDFILHGIIIQSCENGMILRQILIRHLRFEKGKLQVAHLRPADDFRIHFQVQGPDDPLDILDRDIQVPACIHDIDQRPEPHDLFGNVAQIGTVDAAAHPDDAVIAFSPSGFFDPVRDLLQLRFRIVHDG